MGIPTFVSAAIVVNNLNGSSLSLGHVEQSRDITVAAAGLIVFMGLLTMLTEVVIIAMHFCTRGFFSIAVVSLLLISALYP